MRLLVTGGAGFNGCQFIRHMLTQQREIEVVNLDQLTYAGDPKRLEQFSFGFTTSCGRLWMPAFAGMTGERSFPPPIVVEGRLQRESRTSDTAAR